jgi:hypothetical protein
MQSKGTALVRVQRGENFSVHHMKTLNSKTLEYMESVALSIAPEFVTSGFQRRKIQCKKARSPCERRLENAPYSQCISSELNQLYIEVLHVHVCTYMLHVSILRNVHNLICNGRVWSMAIHMVT